MNVASEFIKWKTCAYFSIFSSGGCPARRFSEKPEGERQTTKISKKGLKRSEAFRHNKKRTVGGH